VISIRDRLLFVFGNVTYAQKITALRNEITLTAPSGEWMYKQLCHLLVPCLLTVSSTQTEILFF